MGGFEAGLGVPPRLFVVVALDGQGGGVREDAGEGEVGVLRDARDPVVHGEGAQQAPVAGQDRRGPAGGHARPVGQVPEVVPERVGGDVGDDDRFPPVGGRAARADALTGGDPVDGPVVEVGQARRGPVAQVQAVGFGEQHGDEHLLR